MLSELGENFGLRWGRLALFALSALMALGWPANAAAQDDMEELVIVGCEAWPNNQPRILLFRVARNQLSSVVRSDVVLNYIRRKDWTERNGFGCYPLDSEEEAEKWVEDHKRRHYKILDDIPPDTMRYEPETASSQRVRTTVPFRAPRPSAGEKGFLHATVDVEYQIIPCFGELHFAYGLVPNSTRLRVKTYYLDGKGSIVEAPPPQVEVTEFTFRIWHALNDYAEFTDKATGKALGFGCFTGQTREIGKIKELVGEKATKAQIQAFIDKLDVAILANSSLLSAAAEDEIRSGSARPATETAEAPPEPAKSAEELTKEQVAKALRESDANYQKVKAAAEAEAAKHKAAVEAFEAGVREAEAKRVKFEQDQAAHQAELARVRAAEEEYKRQRQAYREQYKKVTGRYPPD